MAAQFKESMNVQALEMARKDNLALGKGLAEAGEEFAKYRAAKVSCSSACVIRCY